MTALNFEHTPPESSLHTNSHCCKQGDETPITHLEAAQSVKAMGQYTENTALLS